MCLFVQKFYALSEKWLKIDVSFINLFCGSDVWFEGKMFFF